MILLINEFIFFMKTKLYTFEEDLKMRLKDPKFRKAWEESEVEYQLAKKLIDRRLEKEISQRELAKKAKTTQAVVSRIESMNSNPSISLLKRLASALGLRVDINFVPR